MAKRRYFLLKTDERRRDALFMGAMIGLNFLASPGTTLAAGLAALLYVVKHVLAVRRGRIIFELIQIPLAAGVAAVIIALFVFPAVSYHGLNVFLTPLNSQLESREKEILPDLLRLQNFEQSRSALWVILFGVGLLWGLARRRFLLLVWAVGLMAVPREGVWLMAVPAALLMAGGIVELIVPSFNRLVAQSYGAYGRPVSALVLLLCLWLAVTESYGMILDRLDERDFILYPAQLKALDWARAHLPADANIIVLGNNAMTEWSPQVAQRAVLNTPYGSEWQPKEEDVASDFEGDIWNCDIDNACYADSIAKYYASAPNIYLISDSEHGKDGRGHDMGDYSESPRFSQVYKDDDVTIVRYTP